MKILEKDFKLENSIGHIVNIVANKLKQELEIAFNNGGYDISAYQWMVLNIIIENNGINQNELALKSKKDKTNIARILEKLEKKKFIKRVKDEEDKRVYKVFSTDLGIEAKSKLSLIASNLVNKSTTGVTKEEHDMCLKTLKKIYANLE